MYVKTRRQSTCAQFFDMKGTQQRPWEVKRVCLRDMRDKHDESLPLQPILQWRCAKG